MSKEITKVEKLEKINRKLRTEITKLRNGRVLEQHVIDTLRDRADKDTKKIERLNQYIDFYNNLTEKQNKSLERLNNIIKELEKELRAESSYVYFCSATAQRTFKTAEKLIKAVILDKLLDLKGDD